MKRSSRYYSLILLILAGGILSLLNGSSAYGQGIRQEGGVVRGRIQDSSSNRYSSLVVVALLREDSTLIKFTRTKKDGSWELRDIPSGKYRLLASHPAYADYNIQLTVMDDAISDVGTFVLEPK